MVAVGLRMYQWDALSLGNDDLSTLTRTRYDSFSELIEKGVKEDVHPAGLQIFMYAWTALVGYGEWAVRLPFLLMGLGSMVLVFLLGKKWASESCGLLMAAALATWQYVIMHHLSIRMYTSGMFLILVMVLCWTNLLWHTEKRPWLNFVGYVLAAALCCYNHYFSMLLAGIIGLTGLFFLQKQTRNAYLAANLLVLLLYLPHIPIFLHQLSMKGIGGWLAKPTMQFFPDYFSFIFHHSIIQMVMVGALVLWGIFQNRKCAKFLAKDAKIPNEMRFPLRPLRSSLSAFAVKNKKWIALLWFLLPMLIGYTYSVLREPVMHYGGLFFSFPFLLLFLFSFIPKLDPKPMAVILLIFMGGSVYSLVWEREHYEIFYNRGVMAGVQKSLELIQEKGADSVVSIAQVNHPYYADYYLEKWAPDLHMDSYDLPDFITFRKWLAEQKATHLSVFWVAKAFPLEYLLLIKEAYPWQVEKEEWAISEYYHYSKQKPDNYQEVAYHFQSSQYFDGLGSPYWNATQTDSIFRFDSLTEYGPTFRAKLSEVSQTDYDILEVEVLGRFDSVTELLPKLVFSVGHEGESLHWQAIPLHRFISEPGLWQKAYFAWRLRHLQLAYDEKSEISIYLWNPGKAFGEIASINIRTCLGNPWLYALIEKQK